MDTISRENNSMLPVGGIIVGVIGLLLGGFGLVQASKANKTLETLQPKIDKIDKIDTVESSANSAIAASEATKKELVARVREIQEGFNQVAAELASLRGGVTKLEEATKKPSIADKGGKKGSEPVVAAPGEYVVKAGDSSGTKIAAANHVSIEDLKAVNPGVNWSKLAVGQKLKLPKK